MKFTIKAKVILDVERIIEADDSIDAWNQAKGINGDEWMDYIMGEEIEICDVEECQNKPRKKKKP